MHSPGPNPSKRYTAMSPDGVEIAVQEWGDATGPEIVFIHGFSLSHLCWGAQVAAATLRGFRLITYDMRGHGTSGKPDARHFYREGPRWADELASILDRARVKRPVLVAWSYGGRVVADYLAQYGTSGLAGLNMIATKSNADPSYALPAMARHQMGMASRDLDENIRSTIAFVEGCARHWDPDTLKATIAMAMVVPASVREALLGRPLEADALLRSIDIPVLFSHGEHDQIVAAAASRHGRSITPGSRLSIYDDAGHAPFLEDAVRFNAELADFVRTCQTAARVTSV